MITYHPSLMTAHQIVEKMMQSIQLQENKQVVVHPYINSKNTSEVGYILQQDHHHYQRLSESNYKTIAITQDGVWGEKVQGIKIVIKQYNSQEKDNVEERVWYFNDFEIERASSLLIKEIIETRGFEKREFFNSDITSKEQK